MVGVRGLETTRAPNIEKKNDPQNCVPLPLRWHSEKGTEKRSESDSGI